VPLMLGGRVVIPEDILRVEEKGAASGVTLINTVPSVMAEMVRAGAIPKNILTVNLAGEALKSGLVKEVQREGVRKIYNLYGPSEDTTYSTYGQIVSTEEPNCPIGKPISNAQAYILDGEGSVQPVGVIGEIHLSGDGLARGYMNKADLTAAAFVPNPYGRQGGERLYRTGDLGRHLPDGSLQFIRRKDEQVKVRGYRIELGEIESALNEHPEVSEAAVVAREDFAGHKRLVGYLVMEAWAELNVAEVRWYLKERLPEYMVPGLYFQLDEMPRTPNGKLNKHALPEPEGLRTETRKYKEPRTDVERTLVAVWEKALGMEGIGIDDNFFELGGHSLLGSQVVSGIMSAFGIDLPLRVVFEAPTIEQMAFVILKLMAQDQDFNVLNEMLTELEQLPDFSDN